MRRYSLGLLAATAMLAAVPGGASAATTIGETFAPVNNCVANFTYLQQVSPGARYAAPASGVITSWSYQADATEVPQLKFKVARALGGNAYSIVGESPLVTPTAGTLNTFPIQIAVQAGDVIGFFLHNPAGTPRPCGRDVDAHFIAFNDAGGDVPQGSTATFSLDTDPATLDVSANLETTPCKGRTPTIAGTAGPDDLSGTPEADVIIGLGGRDAIRGLAGDDFLCGGPGKDTLKGGQGKDRILGQKGEDKLRGGSGRDVCKGGKGDDSAKCEVEKSI